MIEIKIPNYPRKIKTAEARRKKYYEMGEALPERLQIPERYVFRQMKVGKRAVGRLFDTDKEEFVLKNPNKAGTPGFQSIAGNEIIRIHEMNRDKVMDFLVGYFKDILKEKNIQIDNSYFPISIKMELQTQFGAGNWDTDNLWVYHKCFIDSLTQSEIIPDDNNMYVRQSGETTFVPVKAGQTEVMTFIIQEAPEKCSVNPRLVKTVYVIESPEGTPGKTKYVDNTVYIYTGKKKIIFGAAKNAIRSVILHAVNHFESLMVEQTLYNRYRNFFEDHALTKHVTLIVYKAD